MSLSLDLTAAVLLKPAASTRNLIAPVAPNTVGLDLGASALQFSDAQIIRSGVGQLDLRQGTGAARLHIMNAYTDAANLEELVIEGTGPYFDISTLSQGTGTPRNLFVGTQGNTGLGFYTNNLTRWQIFANGDLRGEAGLKLTIGLDAVLERDAANILALRNGANAQALRVYNTWTDVNNYERGVLLWTSNILYILTEKAGTGTNRYIDIRPSDGLYLGSDNLERWVISLGHFTSLVDNAYDIGATGAGRPRAIYVAGSTGIKHQAGASTLEATMVGVANVNTTAVGNVGGGTDDLITYTLPANALSANGKGVRITAWGTTANNANAKTVTLAFGGQTIMTQALTISIAGTWRIEAVVVKNGANTQDIWAELLQLATIVHKQTITAGTQTDTSDIVIKCTGAATSNNDIVEEGLAIAFWN
jgi:hypothetical protein